MLIWYLSQGDFMCKCCIPKSKSRADLWFVCYYLRYLLFKSVQFKILVIYLGFRLSVHTYIQRSCTKFEKRVFYLHWYVYFWKLLSKWKQWLIVSDSDLWLLYLIYPCSYKCNVLLSGQLWALLKVIYPKYSKHWPYTVAHIIDCVCSKMLNHGLFLSLFKLIPCPIHWMVYVLTYLNFIFEF